MDQTLLLESSHPDTKNDNKNLLGPYFIGVLEVIWNVFFMEFKPFYGKQLSENRLFSD